MTAIGHAAPKGTWRSGTAADLVALRADLKQQRRFRIEQLTTLDVTSCTDTARTADDELGQVTLVLRAAATVALADIDAALDRIESDRYGLCTACCAAIPLERLQTLPMVRLCMPCQIAHEQNGANAPDDVFQRTVTRRNCSDRADSPQVVKPARRAGANSGSVRERGAA